MCLLSTLTGIFQGGARSTIKKFTPHFKCILEIHLGGMTKSQLNITGGYTLKWKLILKDIYLSIIFTYINSALIPSSRTPLTPIYINFITLKWNYNFAYANKIKITYKYCYQLSLHMSINLSCIYVNSSMFQNAFFTKGFV